MGLAAKALQMRLSVLQQSKSAVSGRARRLEQNYKWINLKELI